MFNLLLVAALAATTLAAQLSPPPGGGGSTGNISSSGTPASPQLAQFTDATHIKGVPQGVFNVRLIYGAVPDGSTDNSTAIANAFTASNAFTSGVPTVYFDCDTGTSTCKYNYGGSGTSPINPTVPTTILCAPGVYLNYTGSAHAVDLGSSGRTFQDELPYTIQGCVFTGAASSTEGININAYITNSYILNNTFFQFGNRTGFNIYYAGNNWESLVEGNSWYDHDGVTRNMVDGHNAAVNAVRFIDNNVECDTAGHIACSTSTIGVGVWLGDVSVISHNVIQYHGPLVRMASSSSSTGDKMTIEGNHFEGNSGVLIPAITYGDPGGTATSVTCLKYANNSMYYPLGTGTPIVGPETAGSGSHTLADCSFTDNMWSTPSSGTYYVVTGFGSRNIWGRNLAAGTIITASASSPGVFDFPNIQDFLPSARRGNGGALSGLAAFQTNGQDLTAASYHNAASPLLCLDSSGSGTAQSCSTSPSSDITGAAITLVAGDTILYKTTTTNTGDITVNVNTSGATHIRKAQGTSVLAAGDLIAGQYVPLTFDGTFWEMAPASSLVVPTSCTGLPTGALVNNAGLAGFCP